MISSNNVEEILRKVKENQTLNTLWVEKYRPVYVDEYVCNDELKAYITQWVSNPSTLGHLLLYGRPGSGKTSLAKLLVNNLDCDYIYINMSDENGIDTVRDKIKNFVTQQGFSTLKVVIADEFDGATPMSQNALRGIIEQFSSYSRFIFTANSYDKIIDPIKSRCQTIEISVPKKAHIAKWIANILTTESVTYTNELIAEYISNYYPDFRKILNEIQLNVENGNLNKNNFVNNNIDFNEYLINLLISKKDKYSKFVEIRNLLNQAKIKDFTNLYSYLYTNIEKFSTKENMADIIKILSEMHYKSNFCVDKELNFCSTIIQIIEKG